MKKISVLLLAVVMLSGCAMKDPILPEQGMTESEYDRYMTEYEAFCPYGDAVMINRLEQEFAGENAIGVSVDCINYDPVDKYWITWRGTLRGDKMVQRWRVSEYKAYTADGELLIKDNQVVVLDSK